MPQCNQGYVRYLCWKIHKKKKNVKLVMPRKMPHVNVISIARSLNLPVVITRLYIHMPKDTAFSGVWVVFGVIFASAVYIRV